MNALLADPLIALLLVTTTGALLGRVEVRGVSLGSSGVVFTALLAGHLGLAVPEGIGALGLLLFVFGVGLAAGPSFFRTFARHGKEVALLAVALVAAGGATAYLAATLLGLPVDLAAGLFTGAMTSTPGLAAALEAVPNSPQVAVGYGLAYPFGVVGVVLFVQALPGVLGVDLGRPASEDGREGEDEDRRLSRVLVAVHNPAVLGKRVDEVDLVVPKVQIAHRVEGDRLLPLSATSQLEDGMVVEVVGRAFRLAKLVPMLGRAVSSETPLAEHDGYRRQVVASSLEVVGKSLRELELLHRFGVTPVKLERFEIEFVPDVDEVLLPGDRVTVVGEPEGMSRFADEAGHKARNFDATDLASLGAGLLLGLLVGRVELSLAGSSLKLGSAGGPLFVGLLLGHFGGLGPIRGGLPRAARLLLNELGLAFFLAAAGVKAGGSLVAVVEARGLPLCLAAAAVAFVPLALGYVLGVRVLGMGLPRALGATCGAMTSTPGLGALTDATGSEAPVAAYAAAYPVALVLTTVAARALVAALG